MSSQVVKPKVNLDGFRPIIRGFGLNTCTYSIPGIERSQILHNRTFWSLCFLVFTGTTLYFVTQSRRVYFRYTTQTTVDTVNESPQLFPVAVICNYSPCRFDRFIEPYLNYTNDYNATDRSTFSSAQTELLDNLYYSLDSMLIRCVCSGPNCSTSDFISPSYGRCYTFNAQSNHIYNGELHYNNENGDTGKLEFSLYAHSHQCVPFYADGEQSVRDIIPL